MGDDHPKHRSTVSLSRFPFADLPLASLRLPLYWRASSEAVWQNFLQETSPTVKKPWKWLKHFIESHCAKSDVAWPHDHFLAADLMDGETYQHKTGIKQSICSLIWRSPEQIGIKHPVPFFFLPYMLLQLSLLKIINTPKQKSEDMSRDMITGLVISMGFLLLPTVVMLETNTIQGNPYAVDTWQWQHTFIQRLILRASDLQHQHLQPQKWIFTPN